MIVECVVTELVFVAPGDSRAKIEGLYQNASSGDMRVEAWVKRGDLEFQQRVSLQLPDFFLPPLVIRPELPDGI